MPFPFVLPTTSAFSFGTAFACPSHPSLLRNASTYRGVVRDTLKKHKRLPPELQAANLALVVSSLQNYLPYLLAVAGGLRGGGEAGVRVVRVAETGEKNGKKRGNGLDMEWRPTLAVSRLPGKEPARVRMRSLDHEVAFALATLGLAYTLQARAALQPLYVVASVVPVGGQQRLAAITGATRHLLDAAAVFSYAAETAEAAETEAAAPDIAPPLLRAQAALALAEATLLAVLKDDPYPAAVAQARNENDREWMYKAPDIPKVRAHLFARLCLAAADHAARAAAAAHSQPQLTPHLGRYLDDLQHTSRAKACRFFAIDADLGGQTGTALAWLHAALHEVGGEDSSSGGGGSGSGIGSGSTTTTTTAASTDKRHHLLGRFRKERSEKREDRRVERGLAWGADAGRLEETRVLEMLDAKWTKQNDTINTQRIPPSGPLLAQMPSGREIHALKPWDPPVLDAAVLEAMRAPPDGDDEDVGGAASSSEDEGPGSQYY